MIPRFFNLLALLAAFSFGPSNIQAGAWCRLKMASHALQDWAIPQRPTIFHIDTASVDFKKSRQSRREVIDRVALFLRHVRLNEPASALPAVIQLRGYALTRAFSLNDLHRIASALEVALDTPFMNVELDTAREKDKVAAIQARIHFLQIAGQFCGMREPPTTIDPSFKTDLIPGEVIQRPFVKLLADGVSGGLNLWLEKYRQEPRVTPVDHWSSETFPFIAPSRRVHVRTTELVPVPSYDIQYAAALEILKVPYIFDQDFLPGAIAAFERAPVPEQRRAEHSDLVRRLRLHTRLP